MTAGPAPAVSPRRTAERIASTAGSNQPATRDEARRLTRDDVLAAGI